MAHVQHNSSLSSGLSTTNKGESKEEVGLPALKVEESLEEMSRFYNLFPYPGRSAFVMPRVKQMILSHVGFCLMLAKGRTEHAQRLWNAYHPSCVRLRQGEISQSNKVDLANTAKNFEKAGLNLLLAGCGTDEPVLQAALHKNSRIDAFDLSKRSLRKAKFKWVLYRLLHPFAHFKDLPSLLGFKSRLKTRAGDVNEHCLSKHASESYDHIQCFGVLHHQQDPKAMLVALNQALKPGGTLRLMVYSHQGRQVERSAQRLFHTSLSSSSSSHVSSLNLYARALRLKFWMFKAVFDRKSNRQTRLAYTSSHVSRLADALLHPSDPGLPLPELKAWTEELGLKMVYCCAKSASTAKSSGAKVGSGSGWLVGIQNPEHTWGEILEAEQSSEVVSNVELVLTKPVAP